MIITILSAALFVNGGLAQNTAMTCYEDQFYVNDYDGYHEVIKTDYLINGQQSVHDSHHEDRRFKWRYCKPTNTGIGPFRTGSDKSVTLSKTAYDEEWTRSCADYNGGHSALHGVVSKHDSHREDREFTFYCGLLDLTRHRLEGCSWTGIINSYDGGLDYDCSNNGLIRSIWSRHDSHHEDRIFRFECCTMVDIVYEFENIVGEWKQKHSCLGCKSTEYMREYGTESTVSETIESSYSNSLSTTVSAGFEFKGFSSSVEVTGEQSETISNQMTSSFSTSFSESTTFTCENTYLYQWEMSGDEERSDGTTGRFHTYSSDYLCTNNANPKCPPGYCQDSDCQACLAPFN